jgi:hypothetical protein
VERGQSEGFHVPCALAYVSGESFMDRGSRNDTCRPLHSAPGRHREQGWLLIVAGILLILGCGTPPDQMAYEEVVATMSTKRAKQFFETYPHSRYRDRLADHIVTWCEREHTRDCYGLILEVLPRDHARYQEVAAYYEKAFGTELK